MTLTGSISIMCKARRKAGWGTLRRECEMRKCRQCLWFVKVKKKWTCGQREYESPKDSLKLRKSICVHVDSNDPGKRETLITEREKRAWDPVHMKSWPLVRVEAL